MSKLEGYKGNPLLKKINQPVEWTSERVIEFEKCMNDPTYFTENYVKIIHIDRGLVPFNLYPWQKEMYKIMSERRRSAFCVARQGGKSVAVAAWLLWFILFHKDVAVGLLANKGDTAREILSRVQRAFYHLPRWLQQGVVEWNKGSIILENDSKLIAAATSSDNVRGFSFNVVYLDETALIENFDEFFASVLPTISSGTKSKIIMTSTPIGLNHFYNIMEYSKRPHDDPEWNGYYTMEVPWNKIPGRDEHWKKEMLQALNYDYEKFEQEFNIQFLGSSGTLIAGWKLKEMVIKKPIKWNTDGFSQYEEPQKEHTYAVIADVSRGKGLDYSALQVIDISAMPYKQVATFRNNLLTPGDFTAVVHRMATQYNNAYVLVEVNDIGEQVGYGLMMDFEYENVLLTESGGAAGKRLTAGFGSNKSDKGVRTTKLVKSQGCSMMKYLIEEDQLIVNDEATIEELRRFSKKGNSYEAELGSTDDLTMCLVLFGWMTNQNLFKELTNIHTINKLREKSAAQIEEDMLPVGWSTDGSEEDYIVDEKDVWKPVRNSYMFDDAF